MVRITTGAWRDLQKDASAVRVRVFVEEQKIPLEMEWDEADKVALHAVAHNRLGQPVGECRRLSQEELAKLPPNMRDPVQCPRERAPLSMEVDVGGKRVLQRVAQPTGLSKDGSASIYERLVVAAGPQQIEVRFKDDVRPGATTYHRQASVDLVPGQVLVVDFDAEKGGITLQ